MKTTPADEEPEDDGGGERGTAGFEHEHLFRISPTPGNTLPEGPSASHAQQDNWDDEIFEPPTSLCSNVTTPASSAPVLAQSRDNGAPSEPMSEAFLRWGIQTDQAAMGHLLIRFYCRFLLKLACRPLHQLSLAIQIRGPRAELRRCPVRLGLHLRIQGTCLLPFFTLRPSTSTCTQR